MDTFVRKEKRIEKRYPYHGAVTVMVQGEKIEAGLKDISQRGLCLYSDSVLQKGTEFEVHFPHCCSIKIKSTVVRIIEQPYRSFGAQIDNDSQDDALRIVERLIVNQNTLN